MEALRTIIPSLRQRLAVARNRLAVLIGEPPGSAAIPPIELAGLRLPATVPVAFPSQLVRLRPNILAAEARLARAGAEIEVATANLYPNLTLTGGVGVSGFDTGGIAHSLDLFTSLGANLLGPIFQGGRLRAARRAAVASWQEALALYQDAVLTSFGEVADGIRALENDALALQAQAAALASARKSLDITNFQFDEGVTSTTDVLVIERRFQEAQLAVVDAVARRFQDTASPFAARGPGPLSRLDVQSVTVPANYYVTDNFLDRALPPSALPRPR